MGIQRRVLYDDVLGHPDAEGSKVPHGLDAALHHVVRNLLGNLDGYGQHADMHVVLLHLPGEFIGMKNGNAVQLRADQSGIDVKSRHNLQAEVPQTGVVEQGASQTSHTEQERLVQVGEAQEILEHGNQGIHLVAHPRTSRNVDIRKVLGYLRGIDIDFLGYLGRGDIAFSLLFQQLDIGKIPRETAQGRLGHCHTILKLNCQVRGHSVHYNFVNSLAKVVLFPQKADDS